MSTQTGSISFESTNNFSQVVKQNYATLSQIKGQFATSGTGASTAAKVATIVPTDSGWTLYEGATVTVKFTSKNTTSAPTLNVNGTGAKPIKDYNGNNLDSDAYNWPEGAAMSFTYDGTSWRLQDSDLMERVHTAETGIKQTATSITSLAALEDTYTKPDGTTGTNSIKSQFKQTADSISAKVDKNGVIASINASVEEENGSQIKISADKVNIEGAAIFSSGRLSTTSLNNAYDTKGAANTVNNALENYKSTTNTTLQSLQSQVDGQIEAWYMDGAPAETSYTATATPTDNAAKTWTTKELKDRHLGDIYYDINTGHSWRWMEDGSNYKWQPIPDSDAAAALAAANDAQTIANSKRRIFTAQPTVPYDKGDLWVNGTTIKYCNQTKTDTGSFAASDWVITATDDTLAQSANFHSQRIYFRTNKALLSSINGPATWITEKGDKYNTTAPTTAITGWTTKVTPISSSTDSSNKYLYLYTCIQSQTMKQAENSGTQCSSTTVLLDDSTTVIDGGNIITGTIDANAINADTINGSSLTISSFKDSDNYLNSNIQIGGRNLLAYSETGKNWYYSTFTNGVYTRSTTTTSESFITGRTTVPLELGITYTFSAWMKTNGQVSSVEMSLYDAAAKTTRSKNFGALTTDWEYYTWTVTMPDTWESGTNETATWNARFDNNGSKTSETEAILYVKQPKLEKGNIATDWSPAPEDTDAAINTAVKSIAQNWFAKCSTDGGIKSKVATITPATTNFQLNVGVTVNVKFTADNSYSATTANPITLNVNGSGAKNIYYGNSAIPLGKNTTAFGRKNYTNTYVYDGVYWVWVSSSADNNSTYNMSQVLWNQAVKASTDTYVGTHIIIGDSTGYRNLAAGKTFDLGYPILYYATAANITIASGSTADNHYLQTDDVNFSTNGAITSGVAYATLYLKGTISGNIFTVAASPFMTTVTPITEDGYIYIPLGIMSNATSGRFVSSADLYAFIDGEFRQVTPTEIVATQKIYYRSKVNGDVPVPKTWITADYNIYNDTISVGTNGWSIKVTPMSKDKTSNTDANKYLYLYTCEQRKRLDGTIECLPNTNALLDESTTIIDGGNIITSSITANEIAADAVTADKIKAGAVTTSKLTVTDLTNYCQLNRNTATRYDWTVIEDSSNPNTPWFQRKTLTRNNYPSEWFDCQGGESFRVSMSVSSNVTGATTSGGTAGTYMGINIGINCQNAAGTNSWPIVTIVTSSSAATETTKSGIVTLPADAVRFRAFIQIGGYPTFAGTLKIRKPTIYKMANANLIVDGAITANKIDVTDLQAIGATIGGFQIDTNSIHTKNIATTSNVDNSIALSSDDFTRTINGTSRAGLRLAMGDKFGVTGDGTIYASNVDLIGKITATSGTIGGASIDSNGKLQVPAAQITGSLSADSIKTNVVSAINATANKIDAKNISVSTINIGDLDGEIGGRNLLRWTAKPTYTSASWNTDPENTTAWSRWSANITVEDTDAGIKGTFADNTQQTGFCVPLVYEDAAIGGEDYVFSFDYRTNLTSIGTPYLLRAAGGNIPHAKGFTITPSETEWQHFSCVLNFPSTAGQVTRALLFPYVHGSGGGKWIEIKDGSAKLEKGNRVTDWTPAPEDVNSAIDDASKIASNYIHADSTGINIYDNSLANASKYYLRQTAGGTYIYRNSYLKAKYEDTITLYGGTGATNTSTDANPKVELSSSDFKMTDAGGTQRLLLNSTDGVIIGNPNKGKVQITNTGMTIYDTNSKTRSVIDASGLNVKDTDGSTSVALFAASSRIGKAASGHVIVDSTGMTVYDTNNKKRTQVDAYGLHVFDASTTPIEVALFGSTVGTTGTTAFARIGKSDSSRFEISPTTLSAYTGTTKYFEVSASDIKYGTDLTNIVETTAGAQNKADAAKKTATNYMSFDSTNGLRIAQSNPSGAAKLVQITPSDGILIKNDDNNYAKVNSSGLTVFQDSAVVASFGAMSRIGKAYIEGAEDNESHMELDFHSLRMVDKQGNTYFYVSDLRDANGVATITETFRGNGDSSIFTVQLAVKEEVSATDSSHPSVIPTRTNKSYEFSTVPDNGATITIVYKTESQNAKAYTFGMRGDGKVGALSVAEGHNTVARGYASHAEGYNTTAGGGYSHTEGYGTFTTNIGAHAEGSNTIARGTSSHAEGYKTAANEAGDHAEGGYTTAEGGYSHAEGYNTTASGTNSHAEGTSTTASGTNSHVEGEHTTANGVESHAEGNRTTAGGQMSHAEGFYTVANGDHSHAQNAHTIASSENQTAIGEYNVSDTNRKYALIIGNGLSESKRSNAATIDWDGNYIAQAMAGVIQMFAGAAFRCPLGWLPCDGRAVSRVDYATLYAVIGDTWGAGDGSTTFNLPDLRGRVAVGAGTGTAADATAHALGDMNGEEKHLLTVDEMPAHNHGMDVYSTVTGSYKVDHFRFAYSDNKNLSTNWRINGFGANGSATYMNLAGGGQSHNNMQPYTVINYIICTGKTS